MVPLILMRSFKGEEMFLFPALEKAGIPEAAATVGQHKAIHELVETLESFITDVKKVCRLFRLETVVYNYFRLSDYRTIPNIPQWPSARY
jgi:DUF438 domain-containing protein